ncbi:hypothetical protein ACHHYP_20142 [Achlya hypogyna]|uniref:Glucosidase II beta subunit N-terminal domain-containing protein n=1 Tax=Achlya hypogyna TaxID=1202772 RepID=A0A1V9Z302_ACHHY|nr:hypothetical protein ACHHYP_20142 [Achlya hypogyna]
MDSNARFRRPRAPDEAFVASPRTLRAGRGPPGVAWKIPTALFAIACVLVYCLGGGRHDVTPKFRHDELAARVGANVRVCGKTRKIVLRNDQINDDYCDCPEDGLDETTTSACSHIVPVVEFVCKDARLVPTTVVRDGVCDCSHCEDEA